MPAASDRTWTACNWVYRARAGSRNLTVGIGLFGFPPNNVSTDGYAQSFTQRISDAVGRVSTALSAAPHGMTMSYVGQQAALVHVNYVNDIPDTSALGVTYVRQRVAPATTPGGLCPVQTDGDLGLIDVGYMYDILNVSISIQRFDNWFTQDDTRRGAWESCDPLLSPTFAPPASTCSKVFDFGSTVAHELLHAITLVHPEDFTPSASLAAHCNDIPSRATICAGPRSYRSERRTLDQYDLSTIATHQGAH